MIARFITLAGSASILALAAAPAAAQTPEVTGAAARAAPPEGTAAEAEQGSSGSRAIPALTA